MALSKLWHSVTLYDTRQRHLCLLSLCRYLSAQGAPLAGAAHVRGGMHCSTGGRTSHAPEVRGREPCVWRRRRRNGERRIPLGSFARGGNGWVCVMRVCFVRGRASLSAGRPSAPATGLMGGAYRSSAGWRGACGQPTGQCRRRRPRHCRRRPPRHCRRRPPRHCRRRRRRHHQYR